MKRIKIIALLMMISLAFNSFAQTLDEAGAAFNQAIKFGKEAKYAEAVAAYEQTISICKQLGDDGMDLQLKAEQQLPGNYFKLGKSYFDAKNFTEAIPNFEKSITCANQVGDTKTVDNSNAYLAGIYYSLGNTDYKNEAFDKALENYNKALSFKSGYYKANLGLGLVYKKQGNLPLMKDELDKVIAMAGNDTVTIQKAKDAASSAFFNAGASAIQSKKYSEAVENFLTSQEYDILNPTTYYYLAITYNGLSKWDDAIVAANKALELQTEDKSDIYFELGKSSEKKGDAASACDFYKKVTAGNNVAAAKYQMEQVLKCQ